MTHSAGRPLSNPDTRVTPLPFRSRLKILGSLTHQDRRQISWKPRVSWLTTISRSTRRTVDCRLHFYKNVGHAFALKCRQHTKKKNRGHQKLIRYKLGHTWQSIPFTGPKNKSLATQPITHDLFHILRLIFVSWWKIWWSLQICNVVCPNMNSLNTIVIVLVDIRLWIMAKIPCR